MGGRHNPSVGPLWSPTIGFAGIKAPALAQGERGPFGRLQPAMRGVAKGGDLGCPLACTLMCPLAKKSGLLTVKISAKCLILLVAREGDATTSIQSHKACEFNDLIATGERI